MMLQCVFSIFFNSDFQQNTYCVLVKIVKLSSISISWYSSFVFDFNLLFRISSFLASWKFISLSSEFSSSFYHSVYRFQSHWRSILWHTFTRPAISHEFFSNSLCHQEKNATPSTCLRWSFKCLSSCVL